MNTRRKVQNDLWVGYFVLFIFELFEIERYCGKQANIFSAVFCKKKLTREDLDYTRLPIQWVILQMEVTGQVESHPRPVADRPVGCYEHIEVVHLKILFSRLNKSY